MMRYIYFPELGKHGCELIVETSKQTRHVSRRLKHVEYWAILEIIRTEERPKKIWSKGYRRQKSKTS